jgi:hypothetical protein
MTAVLGDFLRPARAHITGAALYGGDLPVPAKRGVIAELDRLVTTMTRYLDDLALPDDFTPASSANPQVRAGEPVGSTWWAGVITSRPVTAALVSQLAAHSRQLAAWTAQLSRAGSPYAGLPARGPVKGKHDRLFLQLPCFVSHPYGDQATEVRNEPLVFASGICGGHCVDEQLVERWPASPVEHLLTDVRKMRIAEFAVGVDGKVTIRQLPVPC